MATREMSALLIQFEGLIVKRKMHHMTTRPNDTALRDFIDFEDHLLCRELIGIFSLNSEEKKS